MLNSSTLDNQIVTLTFVDRYRMRVGISTDRPTIFSLLLCHLKGQTINIDTYLMTGSLSILSSYYGLVIGKGLTTRSI